MLLIGARAILTEVYQGTHARMTIPVTRPHWPVKPRRVSAALSRGRLLPRSSGIGHERWFSVD